MHVEQVLGDVPPDQRCKCRESAGPIEPDPGVLDRLKKLFGS